MIFEFQAVTLPKTGPVIRIFSSALLQTHYVNYNSTYPLTKPRTEGKSTIYKIGVIADPDKSSRR